MNINAKKVIPQNKYAIYFNLHRNHVSLVSMETWYTYIQVLTISTFLHQVHILNTREVVKC